MLRSSLLILGCFAVLAIAAAPRAQAFTSQPDSAAAITGGAPLADPDDKLKSRFGGSSAPGSSGSGATFGPQGNFQPGSVPGFGAGGYGATYDRGGSGKDD